MSVTAVDFDLNDVPDDDVVPAGTYRAILAKVELKQGKNPGSEYLNFQCQLLDDPHKNRCVFWMVTTKNANVTAQNIGRSQIKKIAKAVGVDPLTDYTQLLNKPVNLKLKVEDSDEYGKQNRVATCLPVGSAPQTAGADSQSLSF